MWVNDGMWDMRGGENIMKTLFRLAMNPEIISHKPRRPRRSFTGIGINFRPIATYLLFGTLYGANISSMILQGQQKSF